MLKSSYAKRTAQKDAVDGPSSSVNNNNGTTRTGDRYRGRSDADGIVFQIRLLIEQHAPGISPHIGNPTP